MQTITENLDILIFSGMGGMFILAVSFIMLHIQGQNRFLEQKDRQHQLQLKHQQELLRTMIRSQESERKRIGQDLHDDVGTALANLRLTLNLFEHDSATTVEQFSAQCKTIIDKVIQDVRFISHNLSPPGIELYGFLGALEELCDAITEMRALQITIDNQAGPLLDALDQTQAISIYRIMEELISNTLKHAQASKIEIFFAVDERALIVIYHDNGIGIMPGAMSKKGMGLHNIESRLKMINAQLAITAPGTQGYECKFKLTA